MDSSGSGIIDEVLSYACRSTIGEKRTALGGLCVCCSMDCSKLALLVFLVVFNADGGVEEASSACQERLSLDILL